MALPPEFPILTLIFYSHSAQMRTSLDHEKLGVYQALRQFITWTVRLLDQLPTNILGRSQREKE